MLRSSSTGAEGEQRLHLGVREAVPRGGRAGRARTRRGPRPRDGRSTAWSPASMPAAAASSAATCSSARWCGQVVEDADERLDQLRVELRAAAAAQLRDALLVRERRPVHAARRHGVVGVDQAEQPGDERDLLAGQAVGVAAAVVALVMVAHAGHVLVVQQRLDDLGADGRVLLHQRPLLVRERPRLEQHAVGHGDLADVVQVGGLLELLDRAAASSPAPPRAAPRRRPPGPCARSCRSPWP